MPWNITTRGGLYLPQIDFCLDASYPVAESFVSHAHFDHMAGHQRVLCSEPTARLMQARMGGERTVRSLTWEEPFLLRPDTTVKLFPAGHIFGSAQLWAEREGESLLYTGDFKLREGRSAEKCATPQADTVIMECTFGLPRYVFPPTEETLARIIAFCEAALEEGEVPVLFGYSLGKSQEILQGLSAARLPIMLHPQTVKMTRIYEQLGLVFPPYRAFDLDEVKGHVVICPPQAGNSAWLRKISPRRTAMVTGWAMDPGAIYRYQCDAMFPLSDHADFNELLRFVELTQPKRVLLVHGWTKEFAQTLRERGVEAWALGSENQLELTLGTAAKRVASSTTPQVATKRPLVLDSFLRFAKTAEAVKARAKKLEKRDLLAAYLQSLPAEALSPAALAFTGRIFAPASLRVLNVGGAILKRSLLKVTGVDAGEYRSTHVLHGDTGETVGALWPERTEGRGALWADVTEFVDLLSKARGPAAKQELLETWLAPCEALEAKYTVKLLTGDLRIGLKEGLVEEAIATAFNVSPEAVREANMLSGDIGAVARAAKEGTLDQLQLAVFVPLHFMLASPEPTADSIMDRIGGPVWVEDKYDGIRCQIHKQGDRVELYSRDLKTITGQFADVVRGLRTLEADVILDGELLAWQDDRALPFAELQKRLGRKGDDFFLGAEIPVSIQAYDCLWLNGRTLLKEPLQVRRQEMERLPLEGSSFLRLAEVRTALDASEIERLFLQARARGNEGLMVKDPASLYTPGRRGLAWLKLKKAYATLDVVVVAAELGHGKRAGVLSDYTFAVRDERSGELKTVGKAYSGLTDAEIARLTEHFLAHTLEIIKGRYRKVVPNVVLEVAFDRIQPSERHTSGFALRFPRIARIRDDKTPQDIDTVETCRRLTENA